jgi:hypothetical protein
MEAREVSMLTGKTTKIPLRCSSPPRLPFPPNHLLTP